MSEASNYLENKLLDHLFGKATYSSPTTYLALCTSTPTDGDTGSTISEATYTSYARLSTAAGDWNAASSGTTTNANNLQFPAATGGSDTITAVAAVDASSGGNLLWYTALDSNLAVSSGITPQFNAGNLSVSID